MQIFGDVVVTVLWINAVYENRDYGEEQSKSDVSPKVSHRIPVIRSWGTLRYSRLPRNS